MNRSSVDDSREFFVDWRRRWSNLYYKSGMGVCVSVCVFAENCVCFVRCMRFRRVFHALHAFLSEVCVEKVEIWFWSQPHVDESWFVGAKSS